MKHAAIAFLTLIFGCTPDPVVVAVPAPPPPAPAPVRRAHKQVLVIVALCDNAHQGIVPVSPTLGNGQDPANNLYWGAAYGIKTYLRRSPHWTTEPSSRSADPTILDRAVFRARETPVELVAEAYDGARMAEAVARFFREAAGGEADLVCFVGHNGLMDLPLGELPRAGASRPGGAVVLACKSRAYFAEPLKRIGCPPLVTTSGFMAPEAYALDALVRRWVAGGDAQEMAADAAVAYARYQKCTETAARRLFVPGE